MSDVPVRLLRETLREDAAMAPSAACLEADTLAAWSDGALSAADRAAAESHAAGCARCQAMLAAMALTAPPAPPRHWWRAGTYRWLVPLAAAAAAVALWVAVPRTPVAPRAVAERRPIAAAAAEPPEQRAADATTVRQEPESPQSVRRKRDTTQSVRLKPDTTKPVTAPPPSLPSTTPVGVDTFALSAAPATPPPAAPPQPAAAPLGQLQESVVVAPNATESVQLRRDRAAAAAPPQALAKTAAAAPEIVSPDRNVRWRLRTAGIVERSVDGGTSWQPQLTGVAAPLVSGAAPSATICWLVGARGTVLRSTDGATWHRVGFPEQTDLTAVLASDAAHATITAADGRTFTTADGGTTWRAAR